MDIKALDQLVEKYAKQGYEHIRVKAGDLEIDVTKPQPAVSAPVAAQSATPAAAPATDVTAIASPMVGDVHLTPALTVGQTVAKGQELGQIESMKLFNPLVAPHAGVLTAILVADQAAVEYQQPLFELRKDR